MGVAVGRIEREFIIKSSFDKGLPVTVHGNQSERDALIVDFNEREICLQKKDESAWIEFKNQDKLSIFISYYGHVMAFESQVLSLESKKMVVEFPKNLIKNLQRKYERVPPPSGIHASFVLKGSKITLNFPKTEEFNPATKPEVSIKFDSTSIEDLMSDFRGKVKELVSTNRITMFRDKEPSSFEENLIARYGQAFYIPSSDGPLPEEEIVPECAIITRRMVGKFLEDEGTQKANIALRIRRILDEKGENGINSELYCPILYHEYVIGYIYTANTGERKNSIGEDVLEYVCQFTKVLAYSLKMHGYFQSEKPEPITYDTNIIDISASGLLFAHSSTELADELVLYTDFEMVLQMGPRKLKVPARVMRKFREANMSYYGILFLDMPPEDFRFLFDFVYGREFTQEDENKWEGGSPPPKIDLFDD